MFRRKSKIINIGSVSIGGNNDILVQSMLKKPSNDVESNIIQAKDLENAGCQILRVSIPDKNSLKLIQKLKENINIPLVADIHFDYNLAIESVFAGIDKIRINPGNIEKENLKKIISVFISVCKQKNIPIRIGLNSGSIEKKFYDKFKDSSRAMIESAMESVRFFESLDFNKIVISLKSSNVRESIYLYESISSLCDYPLHIGITESGIESLGIVKSSIGIGSLLAHGIGDTIRVSLTCDPIREVELGFQILKSLDLYPRVEVVSCPTCGRTTIDVESLAKSVEKMTRNIKKNMKIAVMGCPVNGPGESKNADFGITGANGMGIIFKHGKVIKKVPENLLIDELKKSIMEQT